MLHSSSFSSSTFSSSPHPFPFLFFFFFNDTATTEIYTLSLHDALPISDLLPGRRSRRGQHRCGHGRLHLDSERGPGRSEEHTSELQSPCNLVCRLLLEKKKKRQISEHLNLTKRTTPSRRDTMDRVCRSC